VDICLDDCTGEIVAAICIGNRGEIRFAQHHYVPRLPHPCIRTASWESTAGSHGAMESLSMELLEVTESAQVEDAERRKEEESKKWMEYDRSAMTEDQRKVTE